jgi:hypothetical protein
VGAVRVGLLWEGYPIVISNRVVREGLTEKVAFANTKQN